jgi:hypothetical protein
MFLVTAFAFSLLLPMIRSVLRATDATGLLGGRNSAHKCKGSQSDACGAIQFAD